MIVCTTTSDLARVLSHERCTCCLVPTMGALHDGHASLVRQATALTRTRGLRDGCVVSIFVNPTQFNDPQDLARYPRTLEADLACCEASGAQVVFAPSPSEIYPPGFVLPHTPLPKVATSPGLEDAHRPGHFAGVCMVVRRLFDLVQPACAVFGEKDWQQLAVVSALAQELRLGVEIVPGPTIREEGGLAMSSRNRLLSAEDRVRARVISLALCEACAERSPADAERAMHAMLQAAGLVVEYAVVRDAATLGAVVAGQPARALIAARIERSDGCGVVRLIDSAPWTGTEGQERTNRKSRGKA